MIRLAAVGVVAAQEVAVRPSIAIADIAITPGGWTLPPPQLGSTIVDLMIGALAPSQRFQIYDGQWLVSAAEAGRPNLARLRAAAAEHNVDFLVLGSVTGFDTEHKKKRIGGLLPRVFLLGGGSRDRAELRIAMSFRIVDVRTGEIVATASGEGSSVRGGVSVAGGGIVRGVPVGALVSSTRSAAPLRDVMLNEAVKGAVHAAAQSLSSTTLKHIE
jgi:curli biogenesis system outer membrane secretion channel CsgG